MVEVVGNTSKKAIGVLWRALNNLEFEKAIFMEKVEEPVKIEVRPVKWRKIAEEIEPGLVRFRKGGYLIGYRDDEWIAYVKDESNVNIFRLV